MSKKLVSALSEQPITASKCLQGYVRVCFFYGPSFEQTPGPAGQSATPKARTGPHHSPGGHRCHRSQQRHSTVRPLHQPSHNRRQRTKTQKRKRDLKPARREVGSLASETCNAKTHFTKRAYYVEIKKFPTDGILCTRYLADTSREQRAGKKGSERERVARTHSKSTGFKLHSRHRRHRRHRFPRARASWVVIRHI